MFDSEKFTKSGRVKHSSFCLWTIHINVTIIIMLLLYLLTTNTFFEGRLFENQEHMKPESNGILTMK